MHAFLTACIILSQTISKKQKIRFLLGLHRRNSQSSSGELQWSEEVEPKYVTIAQHVPFEMQGRRKTPDIGHCHCNESLYTPIQKILEVLLLLMLQSKHGHSDVCRSTTVFCSLLPSLHPLLHPISSGVFDEDDSLTIEEEEFSAHLQAH